MKTMNVFDYFFNESKELEKDFVLGATERASFQQIYGWSLRLAEYLRINAGESNHIIIMSQNSLFFIVSYLGILKSGNICVPLNPLLEQDNLNYIVSLTHCRWSFISQNGSSAFTLPVTVINETGLDTILSQTPEHGFDTRDDNFDENRVAEIIFTSGSTGAPKGVMLSHRNLRANTASIIEYLLLTSADISAVVLPFYYCYGLSVLHTHLKVGGSMVLNNNFVLLGSVIDNLLKYKCTGFAGVPSHYQILLRKSKTFTSSVFPHLRYVTQAGGKLHPTFITEFTQAFPQIDFFVMYGQTEATARLSFLPPQLLAGKKGSIGKGIPGVTLQVLNEQGMPVKAGETGEIAAKGENVMVGYFKDADSTAEVLKDGWLYTGDMATVDEDGFIYIVARKKEIMKVAGNRVSPKEIEEVILTLPEVLDCTVREVNDELQGEAIKATVVLIDSHDTEFVKEKILKCCREKLSLYKIPRFWEFTEKLQVASTGKKVKSNDP
jgi:Acyl-CoA synthetases (AMP-forming)/AMP-acid ligases II